MGLQANSTASTYKPNYAFWLDEIFPSSKKDGVQMSRVTVCQTCGDKGFEEALIYCDSCEVYAVHRYCLDSKTVNFKDYIGWFCMDCAPSNSVSDNMEIDQTAKIGLILKKNENRKNHRLNKENKKSRRVSPEISSRLEDRRPEAVATIEHPEVCSEAINRTKKESKRKKCLNSDMLHKKTGLVRNEASVMPSNHPSNVPEHDISTGKQNKSNSGGHNEESEYSKTRTPFGAINDRSNIQLSCVNAGNSCEEAESNKTTTPDRLTDECFDIRTCNSYTRAQPIIEPIWKGHLCFGQEGFGSIAGLVAHLSSLACPRVCDAARSLPKCLSPELLPRVDTWPKSFLRIGGPNDESIGLYFFPSTQIVEKVFDSLVDEMMNKDLAMRTVLEDAELLLFTSSVLPKQCWRFQSKFYLWGVFRRKQASHQ